MPATLRTAAVVTCLSMSLAASGVAAGAAGNASPKTWMANFCSSVVAWEQAVKVDSKKLETTIAGLSKSRRLDLKQVRGKLSRYLGRIVAETDSLVDDLKAVGPPATKDGAKLQAAVVSAFGRVRQAFAGAQGSAKRLPVTTPAAFAKAAIALGGSVQTSIHRLGAAFDAIGKYDTKELAAAAKAVPACKKL